MKEECDKRDIEFHPALSSNATCRHGTKVAVKALRGVFVERPCTKC